MVGPKSLLQVVWERANSDQSARYFTFFTATGEKCEIAIQLDDSSEISRKYLQLLCDFSMGSESRYGIMEYNGLMSTVHIHVH